MAGCDDLHDVTTLHELAQREGWDISIDAVLSSPPSFSATVMVRDTADSPSFTGISNRSSKDAKRAAAVAALAVVSPDNVAPDNAVSELNEWSQKRRRTLSWSPPEMLREQFTAT
eukprot:1199885-Prymnesium_polylepis.1